MKAVTHAALKMKGALARTGRNWAGHLCKFIPLYFWERMFPEKIVSLCYHIVSDGPVAHVKHYRFLTVDEFERDLHDVERRFAYVPYEQILDSHAQPPDRRRRAALCLTFDDGFAECASVIRPILLRHGATCIFFVITDLIDNRSVFWETKISLAVDAIQRRPIEEVEAIVAELGLEERLATSGGNVGGVAPAQMMRHWREFDPRLQPLITWALTLSGGDEDCLNRLCRRLGVDPAAYVAEVKPYLSTREILQLRDDGFTIGAHSCSHRRLQGLSRREAEQEIVESCRAIHALTGQASVPFAFPYFGGGLDRAWLADIRRRFPFVGLFFDTQGLRRDAPFVVQRVFGERIEATGSVEQLLRRAWGRRLA